MFINGKIAGRGATDYFDEGSINNYKGYEKK